MNGAYAIAPDGSQQFKRFGAAGAKSRAEPTADVVVFGQQILEVARYGCSGNLARRSDGE